MKLSKIGGRITWGTHQYHRIARLSDAIPGHHESPRLWEKLIDKILQKIGLRPTNYELCLYQGTYNGAYTLFMRQVDDFAIATKNGKTAAQLIEEINTHLRLPIHILGEVTRFNGMDIYQTKHYVKISGHKYITKLVQIYPSLSNTSTKPIAGGKLPFTSDASYLTKLIHQQTDETTEDEQTALELKMGINYRKAMGEIMFPMIKCRPGIFPHVIILSQFINHPSEIQENALKDILRYLASTSTEGIHYWREQPHPTLPPHPLPDTHANNYTLTNTKGTNSLMLTGFVDSDSQIGQPIQRNAHL
jgi:hypothetical protein